MLPIDSWNAKRQQNFKLYALKLTIKRQKDIHRRTVAELIFVI